jgi:hypothetical protein
MPRPTLLPEPDNLELYYSKPFAIVALAFATGVVFTSGPALVGLAMLPGLHIIAWGCALLFAPALLAVYWYNVRALFHKDAVVILEPDGITDTRQKISFAAWEDVHSVSLGAGETASWLCLKFKNTELAKMYVGRSYLIRTIFRRIRFLGDWNTNLMPLACSRHHVVLTAEAFRQHSLRRRIEALNRRSKVTGASQTSST